MSAVESVGKKSNIKDNKWILFIKKYNKVAPTFAFGTEYGYNQIMKKFIIIFFLLFSMVGMTTMAMASADLSEKCSVLVLEKEKSETENSDKGEDSKIDLYTQLANSLFHPLVSLIPVGNQLFYNDGYDNLPLKPPRT